MATHKTKEYLLTDGRVVTCRQVAKEIKISESAARNRLNRTDDPKKVFAPYSVKNGGQERVHDRKKKAQPPLHCEDELLRLVLRTI
jgi:transposase